MSNREVYALGPDSHRKAGVPQGSITEHVWESEVFEGFDDEHLGLLAGCARPAGFKARQLMFQQDSIREVPAEQDVADPRP